MKPPDRIENVKGLDRFFLGHKEVSEKAYRAVYPKPPIGEGVVMGEASYKKPIHSYGAGFHPSQAQEAREYLEKSGCPTEIDGSARPVFTSRRHRQKVMKALGMHDQDSYNGF